MNTMMAFDPVWDIFNAMMPSPFARTLRNRACGRFPPANVYQDENAVMIDLELPGKTAADVDLTLEAQALTIADKPKEDGASPAWSRRVNLPFRVDSAKANAKFTNGILRIELPRTEADGIRKIAIA